MEGWGQLQQNQGVLERHDLRPVCLKPLPRKKRPGEVDSTLAQVGSGLASAIGRAPVPKGCADRGARQWQEEEILGDHRTFTQCSFLHAHRSG